MAESLAANQRAVELGHVADDTWNFMGASSFHLGELESAVEYSGRALQRTPDNREIAANLEAARAALEERKRLAATGR